MFARLQIIGFIVEDRHLIKCLQVSKG